MLGTLRLEESELAGVDVPAIGRSIDPQALSRAIEPHPDNVKIVGNHVTGNGTEPSFLPLPPVDLLWDRPLYEEYGSGNCWARNVFDTSFPEELPACE